MKQLKALFLIVPIICAGCSSDSGPKPLSDSALPPAAKLSFTPFVTAQYAAGASSETALPVEVESKDFSFADDDNPNAFDTVISTAR